MIFLDVGDLLRLPVRHKLRFSRRSGRRWALREWPSCAFFLVGLSLASRSARFRATSFGKLLLATEGVWKVGHSSSGSNRLLQGLTKRSHLPCFTGRRRAGRCFSQPPLVASSWEFAEYRSSLVVLPLENFVLACELVFWPKMVFAEAAPRPQAYGPRCTALRFLRTESSESSGSGPLLYLIFIVRLFLDEGPGWM